MAEILQKDGTWAFDGDTLRLTPGRDKGVSLLRGTLGELVVPLEALAGISFERGRRAGRLRLRLRDGADPSSWRRAAASPSRTTRTGWSWSRTGTASPSTWWTRCAPR